MWQQIVCEDKCCLLLLVRVDEAAGAGYLKNERVVGQVGAGQCGVFGAEDRGFSVEFGDLAAHL